MGPNARLRRSLIANKRINTATTASTRLDSTRLETLGAHCLIVSRFVSANVDSAWVRATAKTASDASSPEAKSKSKSTSQPCRRIPQPARGGLRLGLGLGLARGAQRLRLRFDARLRPGPQHLRSRGCRAFPQSGRLDRLSVGHPTCHSASKSKMPQSVCALSIRIPRLLAPTACESESESKSKSSAFPGAALCAVSRRIACGPTRILLTSVRLFEGYCEYRMPRSTPSTKRSEAARDRRGRRSDATSNEIARRVVLFVAVCAVSNRRRGDGYGDGGVGSYYRCRCNWSA